MPRNTSLNLALAALAVASMSGPFSVLARDQPSTSAPAGTSAQPSTPTISARARVDTAVLPRAADEQTAVAAKIDVSAVIYSMKHTVFEAEDWGDIPKLGLSVQDMTPFGTAWSGNKHIFWNPTPIVMYKGFYWDFKAPGTKTISIDLTAAPDYRKMQISLMCYVLAGPYKTPNLITQVRMYDGYATTVKRQNVTFAPCGGGPFYRLIFKPFVGPANRPFGGIDRIVAK